MSNENINQNVQEKSKTPKKRARLLDVIAYVVCLLIALSIWAYVTVTENSEYEYQFKGVVVNLNGVTALKENFDLAPISGYGQEITITVKGSRSEILEYTAEDIFAYVDLGKIQSADRYTLDVNVDLPSGIQFVSAEPAKINVFVDETIDKQVPVKVDLLYSAVDNITVLSPEIDDANILDGMITVTGPKSVVETIDHALVVKDIGSVSEGVKFSSQFTLVDRVGEEITNPYIKTDVTGVAVSVKVMLEKVVPIKAVYTKEAGDLYDYEVAWTYSGENVETVKIMGDPNIVSGYECINIEISGIASVKNGNAALPSDVMVYIGGEKVSTITYSVSKTESKADNQ